jgi:hypothetical protein
MSELDPARLIASFDSASVLHSAIVAALRGEHFANLGGSTFAGLAVRAAAKLPWSLLRGGNSKPRTDAPAQTPALPRPHHAWNPMQVAEAASSLRTKGLSVTEPS